MGTALHFMPHPALSICRAWLRAYRGSSCDVHILADHKNLTFHCRVPLSSPLPLPSPLPPSTLLSFLLRVPFPDPNLHCRGRISTLDVLSPPPAFGMLRNHVMQLRARGWDEPQGFQLVRLCGCLDMSVRIEGSRCKLGGALLARYSWNCSGGCPMCALVLLTLFVVVYERVLQLLLWRRVWVALPRMGPLSGTVLTFCMVLCLSFLSFEWPRVGLS